MSVTPSHSSPGEPDPAEARRTIDGAIEEASAELWKLNQHIHSHPEIAYEEHDAHDTLCAFLAARGFSVTRHAYGLDTSFEAETGSGGRLVILCAEYDALPGIGHACGHSLIATTSMTAFIGLAMAVQKLGIAGRVRILGTPAEETGGGKAKLIEAGAFRGDVAAAIMSHPIPSSMLPDGCGGIAAVSFLASYKVIVEFTGKSSHASGEPWSGINALDAAVSAYNSISMMRQQIHPDERIHGVIEDGGKAPNVIPHYARMKWAIRSPTMKGVSILVARTKACFEAAALSSGCKVNYIELPTYTDFHLNKTLCKCYMEDMADLGENIFLEVDSQGSGSTDMSNVSQTVPSFHGTFSIPSRPGVTAHHPAFTEAAGTEEAHAAAIKSGKGLAMLGWRVLSSPEVAERAKREFEQRP